MLRSVMGRYAVTRRTSQKTAVTYIAKRYNPDVNETKGQDMATIKIKTNAAEINRNLSGQIKKVGQAGKAALSKTVLQVQHAERIELNRMFTVRKAAFMRNRIKITKFPSADNLTTTIGIDDNVRGSKLLLSQFEDGGKKLPVSGSRVAVPLTGGKARKDFKKGVAPSLRIDRLALHSQVNRKGKGGAIVGSKRTFILPTKKGEYALFQRGGKGSSSEASPLYLFRNNVSLKKRMKFVKIATDLAQEQLPKLFARYMRLYIK